MNKTLKYGLLGIFIIFAFIFGVLIYQGQMASNFSNGFQYGADKQLQISFENCVSYHCHIVEETCTYLDKIPSIITIYDEKGINESNLEYKTLNSEERANLLISKDLCLSILNNDPSYYNVWIDALPNT